MFSSLTSLNSSQKMAILTVVLTLVTSAFGLFSNLKNSVSITAQEPRDEIITIKKNSDLYKSISMIDHYRNETIELQNTLTSLKNTSTLTPDNLRIEELESKIKTLQLKLDNMNSIIVSSPEKALSLPMMRKDIDSLDKSMSVLSSFTENQFERFYNLFLWICGTLVLSVAGLGLSFFLSNKSGTK
ncbi:TPA: hypothetical protein NBJ18_001032 [Citrobacter farmeri]|nr:hypothetical protein [Citrobacter farmeri]